MTMTPAPTQDKTETPKPKDKSAAAAALPVLVDQADPMWDSGAFAHAQRAAALFAASHLVPEHVRNVPDIIVSLLMAKRMREDPLILLQSIYFVSGKPGWLTQYVIGRANRSGVFTGRINWRVEKRATLKVGEKEIADLSVTAFAVLAETGEEVSYSLDTATAISEGWTRNAKYFTLTELMLRYRSAAILVRLYAPEVMLGVSTIEEIEDRGPTDASELIMAPAAPGGLAGAKERLSEKVTHAQRAAAEAKAAKALSVAP